MGDILKEAIADAKAVRETALENAKMALEEAFTPQLKSMLSAKLKEEDDDEVEVSAEEDEEAEEVPAEEGTYEEEEPAEEEEVPAEEDEEAEEVPAEEGEHDAEEVPAEEDEEETEEALDLEAIIKELESELTEDEDEDDDDDEVSEGEEESDEEPVEEEYEITLEGEDDDDKEEVEEELDKSSDIGKSDNNRGSTDASSAVGKGGQEDAKKLGEALAELKEYKDAVHFLKGKLNELNILNAKLLFTNKLFKEFALDNNQKLKVVETFDRAQTTREIKLVYSTLCEQFVDNSSINRKNITESIASSKSGSTKPSKESRKVISEENDVANRFRKLAGLNK